VFQPNVLSEAITYDRSFGKRNIRRVDIFFKETEKIPNLLALAEGEGGMATCLGRPGDGIQRKINLKIIHRVPSVEGGTATCLGNLNVTVNSIKIYLKSAPDSVFLSSSIKEKELAMERKNYSTDIIGRGKEYSFEFKQDVVFAAQEIGIKPTARRFKVSKNTVKSWLRRFESKGKKGLYGRRKGPKVIPNKMPKDMEERIVSIRKMASCFGPLRIKYYFDIPYSLNAIQRVIRQHKLNKKRRKVREKRRDMRAVKAKRKSMAHMQMDVKYLTDIPNYWEQLKPLGLPKFQYTIRETKTGMLFLGYSDELSGLNAMTMVDYVLDKMKPNLPFDMSELTVQTDNGSEFSGLARRIETNPYVQMIEKTHGANHVYIRPGHCNAQADVESSHQLIEEEFFDLTRFSSRDDFFRKIESYRLYFNFTRPNFYKGIKTPNEICTKDLGNKNSYNLCLINTIDLDRISTFSYQRGQTIPALTA